MNSWEVIIKNRLSSTYLWEYRYIRLVSSESVPHMKYDFCSSNLGRSVRNVFQDFYEIDIGKCYADTVFDGINFVKKNKERSHHVYITYFV